VNSEWNKLLVSHLAKLIADAVLTVCFAIKERLLRNRAFIKQLAKEDKEAARDLKTLEEALKESEIESNAPSSNRAFSQAAIADVASDWFTWRRYLNIHSLTFAIRLV
jgi:hypothetical protein